MHKHHKKSNKGISDIFKKAPENIKAKEEKKEEAVKTEVAVKEVKVSGEVIEWKAPEFEYEPKSVSWYWMSLIISIVLISIALWQTNFLFVVFIIIAELILIYFSNQFPKIWDFKIDDIGISISKEGTAEKIINFGDMLGFDIHPAGENYKELVLHTKFKLSPYIKIFISDVDEKVIEEKLSKSVAREEISPSVVDTLEKMIRF